MAIVPVRSILSWPRGAFSDRENSPEAARTGGEGERASFPSGCCWVCSEDQVSAESSVGQGGCHYCWVGLVCRGAAPLSAPASRGEAEQDFEPKPRGWSAFIRVVSLSQKAVMVSREHRCLLSSYQGSSQLRTTGAT